MGLKWNQNCILLLMLKSLGFCVLLCLGGTLSFAASTEQYLKKAAYSAMAYSRGDRAGAVSKALPSKSLKVNRTRVNWAGNRVGLNQPVLPAQKLGPAYYSTNYTANTHAAALNKKPSLAQSVDFNVGSKYFKNTTRLSPD
jgi:hypothetical protein